MSEPISNAKKVGYAMEIARQAGIDFTQRKFSEARDKFLLAQRSDPRNPDYLCNLAACHLELGHADRAIASASDAIALSPGLGFAYVNRADAYRMSGRMALAAADYQSALERDARNPMILNKAGACLMMMGRFAQARDKLVAALSLEPRFVLARLNLGLVALGEFRIDEAQSLIREALEDQGLDPPSRRAAETGLKVIREQRRWQPFIRQALKTRSPWTLEEAGGQGDPDLSAPDRRSVERLGRLADACCRLDTDFSGLQPVPDPVRLTFVEALSNCKLVDTPDSMAEWWRNPGNPGKPTVAAGRNLLFYFGQCRARQQSPLAPLLAQIPEALLRFWHARLLPDQPESARGQFKVLPSPIGERAGIPATPVEGVRGTLQFALASAYPGIPAGPRRALFLLLGMTHIRAFRDGNGRIARFLMNWELESSGYQALAVPPDRQAAFVAACQRSLETFDLTGVAGLLVEFGRYTRRCTEHLAGIQPDPRFN